MNGKTLTKADIVDYIYEKTERNRAEVKVLVDHLLELMKDSIKRDNSLLVSGFGKFESYDIGAVESWSSGECRKGNAANDSFWWAHCQWSC